MENLLAAWVFVLMMPLGETHVFGPYTTGGACDEAREQYLLSYDPTWGTLTSCAKGCSADQNKNAAPQIKEPKEPELDIPKA
jgi:hypothetical protein